jgi:hypothetical protein
MTLWRNEAQPAHAGLHSSRLLGQKKVFEPLPLAINTCFGRSCDTLLWGGRRKIGPKGARK